MKSFFVFMIFIIVSLALISQLSFTSALELTCQNFTGDKEEDCEYLTSQGFSYEDEQEALNILWEQSYEYEGYIWEPITEETTIEVINPQIKPFDLHNLVLASKIFFFGFINYVVFSLTKSNLILKWLSVV